MAKCETIWLREPTGDPREPRLYFDPFFVLPCFSCFLGETGFGGTASATMFQRRRGSAHRDQLRESR